MHAHIAASLPQLSGLDSNPQPSTPPNHCDLTKHILGQLQNSYAIIIISFNKIKFHMGLNDTIRIEWH